jgi:drug/metabolite transporter (DMT)-like permease
MAIFGSGTPVSKLVTEAFPVFTGSGLRMAIAAALLTALVVVPRRDDAGPASAIRAMSRQDVAVLTGIALGGVILFSVFMLYGMREIPGAVGGVGMATTPAVTAAGSVLFMRDHLDRWKAIGIAAAVGGVVAVNVAGGVPEGSGDRLWLGTLLVFGAVCGEASYTLLGKKLTADLRPLTVAALAAVLAAVLFLPLAAWQAIDFDWSSPDAGDWAALGWWGAGTMGLGSWLWYRGVQRVAGTTASGFMGVMPVSALVCSYVLLGEDFAWIHVLGMAGVLAGLAFIVRSHARGGE